MPIKVQVAGPVQTAGKIFQSLLVAVPGIGTGAAYAAGDAFGGKFEINVPLNGVIYTARYLDKDDEGIETDLLLFTDDFVATADNAAYAITDLDLQGFLTTITFATFKDLGSSQVSTAGSVGVAYVAPGRKLYCQMVTRGAPNIAANNIPMVALTIVDVVD